MTEDRGHRGLMIGAILLAFALGVLFGGLVPRRYLPSPRVALAPGPPEGSDEERGIDVGLDELADSVPGNGTATAPFGYPVKGNARSGIYHVPGAFAYDRTVATIFFRSPVAAETAKFRAAKS